MVCHRILWSLVVAAIIVVVQRDRTWIAELRRRPRRIAQLGVAALVLSGNWLVYIWAVNNDHVVEASLGYFIGPLVTVALGVVVLGEHLRRMQVAAVTLGAIAVAVLTVAYGRLPWIAVVLAATFAAYGFIKKQVPLGAAQSLAGETALVAPFALVALVVMEMRGSASFGRDGVGMSLWLVSAGPVTAAPLLCFGFAARRIPLVTIGLIQYLTPTLQFLCGVVVFDETLSASRWFGMMLVWGALILLSADALFTRRRPVEANPV